MADQNKLQDMIRTSLESIRAMVDANTVVGTPITAAGTTIIPISKVSVGYASGGLDFGSKASAEKNFGGGGGTGLTVQPVCFLTVDAEGKVEIFPIAKDGPADSVERWADVIEKAPDILARVKAVLKKAKRKKDGKDDEDDADLDEVAKEAAEAAEAAAEAPQDTEEA